MNRPTHQGKEKGTGGKGRGKLGKAVGTVLERLEERRLLSAPAQVWVDDNWAGLSPGDTAQEPGGASHTYGVDAYSTIQDGVNFVNDGGIVVVLDNRILSKRYGQAFLEALPKCPVEVV
jgi:hypothetical protein